MLENARSRPVVALGAALIAGGGGARLTRTREAHHPLVMRRVQVGELMARLDELLGEARAGRSVVVLDGETPIARIVPAVEVDEYFVRRATRRSNGLRYPGPPARPTDSLADLLEDRDRR